jgi:hypothetical protein
MCAYFELGGILLYEIGFVEASELAAWLAIPGSIRRAGNAAPSKPSWSFARTTSLSPSVIWRTSSVSRASLRPQLRDRHLVSSSRLRCRRRYLHALAQPCQHKVSRRGPGTALRQPGRRRRLRSPLLSPQRSWALDAWSSMSLLAIAMNRPTSPSPSWRTRSGSDRHGKAPTERAE